MTRIVAEITIKAVREVDDNLTDEQLELAGENFCNEMELEADCFGDSYGFESVSNSGAEVVNVE